MGYLQNHWNVASSNAFRPRKAVMIFEHKHSLYWSNTSVIFHVSFILKVIRPERKRKCLYVHLYANDSFDFELDRKKMR